MKFRIQDLLFLTALVGAIAAAYRSDLQLFRELLLVTMTLIFSVGSLAAFASVRWRRLLGGLGGMLGAALFLLATGLGRYWVFEPPSPFLLPDPPRFGPDHVTEAWLLSCFWAPGLGAVLGATAGPLVSLYLQRSGVPRDCRIQWRVSWLLLAGVLGLLVFESLDRIRGGLGGRDWGPFRLLLTFVFVIHTLIWLRRLETGGTLPVTCDEAPGDRPGILESAP